MNIISISDRNREQKLVLEHIAGYEICYDGEKHLWQFAVLTCAGTSAFFFEKEEDARALEKRMDTMLGYTGTTL